MKTKSFNQVGTFSILVLVPTTILFLILLVNSYTFGESNLVSEGTVFGIFFICALTFYRIKISVSEKYVSFKMGIGLMRKKYKVADLKS
ncbi:MAG: hypothetical protein ACJASF_002520, partial [Vicingaceae bacterium]